MTQYVKQENDIKKGVLSREPDEFKRLEDEDLIKMNLNDAICGLSEDEMEVLGHSEQSINLFMEEEEQKT